MIQQTGIKEKYVFSKPQLEGILNGVIELYTQYRAASSDEPARDMAIAEVMLGLKADKQRDGLGLAPSQSLQMNNVKKSLYEHLGPIDPLDNDTEAKLIDCLVEVAYPNGININRALAAIGVEVSDRQLRPYKDALILGYIGGLSGDDLKAHIKATRVFYPGAQMKE